MPNPSPALAAIRPLPRPEATRLRSSLVISGLPRVLAELAQNALDANASRIDCWVNVMAGDAGVRVEDDGCGMGAGEMKEVGERYASSKASTSTTWAGTENYGFRGEALASIAALSLVKITSRADGPTTTKVIKNGQVLFLGPAAHNLPRAHGTTVVVREIFNSIPVRQAALNPSAMAGCRRVVETLALVAPRVRWTLWEDRIGGAKQVLSVQGGRTSLDVFRGLYGHAGVERVQSVRVSAGDRRVDGFISLEGGVTRSHQHLYVNGYPVHNSELHAIIGRRFAQSQFSAMANDMTDDTAPTKKRPSPRRLERHPVYVLNITLPPHEVDAAYDPGKSTLGYREPGQVRSFLTAVVDDFLRRQGFAPRATQDRCQSPTPSPSKRSRATPRAEKCDGDDLLSGSRLGSVAEEGPSAHQPGSAITPSSPTEEAAVADVCASPAPPAQNADWVYDLIRDHQASGVYSTRPDRLLASDDNLPDQEGHADPTRLTELSTPLSDIEFPSSSLASPRLLRQVDRKFIPAVLTGTSRDKHHHNVLVIFDQHAADERAAVESILDALCTGFARDDMPTTQLEDGAVGIILTRAEAQVLEQPAARAILQRWGIDLAPIDPSAEGDYVQVGVLSVPSLLERLASRKGAELTRLLKVYLPLLAEHHGEIEALIASLDANGGDTGSARVQRWMPREMVELANSKACRGAIMFEDKLDTDQCDRLLQRLAGTRNPWVCAHGRPTFVPLCVLPRRTRTTPKRQIDWSAWQVNA